MVFAKRLVFFIFFMLVILLIGFWGFKNNFPGNSIARSLKKKLTKQIGVPVEIKDFELGWLKISTPEISLHTPKWVSGINSSPIIIFQRIEAPFKPIITSGEIIINGDIHGGKIRVSSNTFSVEELNLSIDGLKLESIPLKDLIPQVSINGKLSISGYIKNFYELQNKKIWIPKGYLKGTLTNTKIKFSGKTTALDIELPDLNFSEIIFDIQLGNTINIKRVEFKGSFKGLINGLIQLNLNRLQMSLIDINLELILSSILKERTKIFSTFIRPLQCDEKININIRGTINRFNYPKRNKC